MSIQSEINRIKGAKEGLASVMSGLGITVPETMKLDDYPGLLQYLTQFALGWYATETELKSAHPSGKNGQWAIIGSTDTIWTWDSDTNAWKNTSVKTDLTNYYTKDQSDGRYLTKTSVLNLIYPVGSIYMSANNVSPQNFLGGTWTRIEGRFLLAADSAHSAGSTGGSAQVTLQAANMPTMVGYLNKGYTVDWGDTSLPVLFKTQNEIQVIADVGTIQGNQAGAHQEDQSVNIPGENTPVSIMPLYLAVYMWKRIA